jgi:predicted esterase
MLVVPGGGFQTRVIDSEGTVIAQWLRKRGIAAFILRYRIRPIADRNTSVADGQRALRYIRAHASEYGINPNRIGGVGFSAGAELLHLAAMLPAPASPDASDPVEKMSGDLNFVVLAYGSTNTPAPTTAPSANAQSANAPNPARSMPPTFLFCTAEDMSHLTGMTTLYSALARARVPVEAHFFESGEHGVGFASGDPVLGQWPELMLTWIRSRGLLTDKPRVAAKGIATIDGEPLPRGVVVFKPIDQPAASPVSAYVMNTGPVRGEFNIPAQKGIIPGRYAVEIHQYAVRWMSNSREPFILEYNAKRRNRTLTEQDEKDYLAFARARNLEPSIEDDRVFTSKRPGESNPIVVEIKPEGNDGITIEVFSK